jgi:wyosine [tRNA(Phe)-imidazoG37] synthetase (radical SAM superfamily)
VRSTMSEQTEVPRTRIIGGLVCTRTADHSLHVNLLPGHGRLCTLDCVYCPFPRSEEARVWRLPGDIGSAVRKALNEAPELDSITISGPGEPTLHPRFGQALAEVLSARLVRPALPVRIVTNGTTALKPHIRRLLEFADERLVRIDAGGDRIARPRHELPHEEIAAALHELPDFTVESVFVEGPGGNTGDRDVSEWIERLAELRPKHVTVTTVAEAPLDATVRRAEAATLERSAERLRDRTGLAATALP